MPARTVQRVEKVPYEEWRSICLECQWVGDEVSTEADGARQAYEHNRDRHDGAGVDFDIGDLNQLTLSSFETYRRLYRRCLAMTAAMIVMTCYTTLAITEPIVRVVMGALTILCAVANAFLGGKWAARMEACLLAGEFPTGA